MFPRLIILANDYGADWPTWVPAPHEPPDTGRTSYYPLDNVDLSEGLRTRLFEWQSWWEHLTGPPESECEIDQSQWTAFIAAGNGLVAALKDELGSDVEVRLGYRAPPDSN